MIALPNEFNNPTDWWNAYNPQSQSISSHWMEMSRGKMHVLGKAYYVKLGKGRESYTSDAQINKEIWDTLSNRPDMNWKHYDRWKDTVVNGKYHFVYDGDGIVDMIYKFSKTKGIASPTGYAGLNSGRDTVDHSQGIVIEGGYWLRGSGATLQYVDTKAGYIGGMMHEHCHYTHMVWTHMTYSKVSYGFGFDGFASPSDMIINRYMTMQEFDFTDYVYELGEYVSRNSSLEGNILKVPIDGTNDEFFMLTYRSKSSYWDRIMLGDTAILNRYGIDNDYGKGVYIYHVPDGISIPNHNNASFMDLESADGYWDWEFVDVTSRDDPRNCYTDYGSWRYYNKVSPRYDNDPSVLHNTNLRGDFVSFHYKHSGTQTFPMWWARGKAPSSNCNLMTDRIFTNDTVVSNAEFYAGSRWDPWIPGYNEVFSPYSSPSTKKWNNDESDLYIILKEINESTKTALFEIYKVGEQDLTDLDILAMTPPSRPMGLKVDEYYIGSNCYPMLIWNHNQEPDMERENKDMDRIEKRYKIYRSTASSMSNVPPDKQTYPEDVYTLISTVDVWDDGTNPAVFVDTTVRKYDCIEFDQPPYGTPYPVRYRVQAVDIYEDLSVLSDFVSTVGVTSGGVLPGVEQMPYPISEYGNDIPSDFALIQNFPNPFNPVTNIRFDLPKDEFVSIKVYDLTGREIAVLVNGMKQAGRYIVGFDASHLASGIYFYTINAGEFKETKRMLLLK